MIQFNLLPKVKLDYVKAQRTKRLLITVSIIVSIASLFVLLLSFLSVNVVQKKSIRNLDKDISSNSIKLKNVRDLDKILTVQNQLGTLTDLHDKKPVTSRLFAYIAQLTPAQASLNKLTLDFTADTLIVGGTAPSLDVVSSYTDTLKATTYAISGTKTSPKAFSNVVLTTFGRDDKGATFTIKMNFVADIFNSKDTVTLKVPNSVSVDQSSIFQGGN